MNEKDVEVLSEMIIDKFMERSGFSDWFYNIDDEIIDEIYHDLNDVIREWMNEKTYEMDDE